RTWPAGTKKTEIYEEIKRLKDSGINIAKFCYDKVGVGDKVKNDLIDNGILNEYQIESLTYSLQNKSEVFVNFQSCFEQGILKGRDIGELREQLFGLEVTQMEGSSHLKIHHRTEGIHDDECFVAGTLILTDKGNVPIEKLKIGDKVITPFGIRLIIATNVKKTNKLLRLKLKDKTEIIVTPNHKFYTNKTFIRADALTNACCLETNNIVNRIKWKLIKKLSIMEKNIGFRDFIITKSLMGKKNVPFVSRYIEKYGKIIMGKFQKDSISTTKMKIKKITPWTIFNLSLLVNISNIITLQKNKRKKQGKIFLHSQDPKLLNGINRKTEENGIRNNTKLVWGKVKKSNIPAYIAKKNTSLQERKKQNSAMLIAEKNIIEDIIKKKGIANYVKKKFWSLNILESNIVQRDVLQFKEKEINVYNITVEKDHVYYANGVLVRNCDSLANACWAARLLRAVPVTLNFQT
ncbi:MAG: Hint domain-containing protein, partial [Nanoarchaeota archaeon]